MLTACTVACIRLLIFLVLRYVVTAFHVLFDECKCDVFVNFDMCGVFVVLECRLILVSGCCMWSECLVCRDFFICDA